MNNPRINIALEILGIDNNIDIDRVFLIYNSNEHKFSCSLYLDYSLFGEDDGGQPPLDYSVSSKDFLDLLSAYTGIEFAEGTDRKSVYLKEDHRKVMNIRYSLPVGYLQMDLEDEFINTPTDDVVSEYLRSLIALN